MRLYRQKKLGIWADVVERVFLDLYAAIHNRLP